MKFESIKKLLQDVKPYDKGTHTMWTDPYISKQLLHYHLNPDMGAASRTEEAIHHTIQWIVECLNQSTGTILDLGCGPGLYTSRLAKKGYTVTGVDYAAHSIAYAKQYANEHHLTIDYMCGDYLEIEMDTREKYDMVMMIYCDFGVLIPEDRKKLIQRVYNLLKVGGIFIFDALDQEGIVDMSFQKHWECDEGVFWQPEPYMLLTNSLHFPDYKALLDEHIVIDKRGDYKLYRFWNHYFSPQDVEDIFKTEGFRRIDAYPQLLKGEGAYNDKHVTFYKVTK
ncbi:class I SAM-dependent methyltransferase [Vallitalea pronyensis]|uniref:Class I SAM-dependent methyltransferase n=1 Tax=Vallitalea pronyensis TaxID=1348613 RepID=A0A8J8SIB6_9FIRM|nr:class I SAM-dependent methyltransferase [Vallitalea pronyensis]QUI24343.1 class I SAM-dependent methyltransferase [Vallitalea pronyensis]